MAVSFCSRGGKQTTVRVLWRSRDAAVAGVTEATRGGWVKMSINWGWVGGDSPWMQSDGGRGRERGGREGAYDMGSSGSTIGCGDGGAEYVPIDRYIHVVSWGIGSRAQVFGADSGATAHGERF